jgi:hypothetical protein
MDGEKLQLQLTHTRKKEWNQTLITKVNQTSAQIHKSTLRGGANFIVVSSEISAIFDDLEYFHVSDANPEQDSYNMGIERIGSLSGRYCDPMLQLLYHRWTQRKIIVRHWVYLCSIRAIAIDSNNVQPI